MSPLQSVDDSIKLGSDDFAHVLSFLSECLFHQNIHSAGSRPLLDVLDLCHDSDSLLGNLCALLNDIVHSLNPVLLMLPEQGTVGANTGAMIDTD